MNRVKLFHRFQLYDDPFFYQEIDSVSGIKPQTIIDNRQFNLSAYNEPLLHDLMCQANLIGLFEKSRPKSTVYFYCTANDLFGNRIYFHKNLCALCALCGKKP